MPLGKDNQRRDGVCLSEQIKANNNAIRNLTGEYKKIGCREGVHERIMQRAQ